MLTLILALTPALPPWDVENCRDWCNSWTCDDYQGLCTSCEWCLPPRPPWPPPDVPSPPPSLPPSPSPPAPPMPPPQPPPVPWPPGRVFCGEHYGQCVSWSTPQFCCRDPLFGCFKKPGKLFSQCRPLPKGGDACVSDDFWQCPEHWLDSPPPSPPPLPPPSPPSPPPSPPCATHLSNCFDMLCCQLPTDACMQSKQHRGFAQCRPRWELFGEEFADETGEAFWPNKCGAVWNEEWGWWVSARRTRRSCASVPVLRQATAAACG